MLIIAKSYILDQPNIKTTIYSPNGTRIQTSDVEKDWGILVNTKLNWTQHTITCLNATFWRK